MKNQLLIAMCTVVLASPVLASDKEKGTLADVGMDKTDGCMTGPTAQFGRYVGDWDIADETLSQDGKTWTRGPGARWHFTCVGNGTAIQDFWMPNGGGFGTNLRMYDKDKGAWDIAWTNKGNTAMAHISAVQNADGHIVMHFVAPKPNPARRITFFPPDENGWNWQLEISTDGEKSWRTVYRIKATRR
ncbi:hypothetical protein SAMN02745824_3033 [Parasphingorhabdus marina DSM 22363]|uniref:DUF1579 domain-containing protein n=1 Tax=Parasphingorhabdus marina DSM 22363 TaxID=1123272 RepID=A0A1N6GXC7_9SPHN|nr:hypothetical protein [Parasphingorhabdus marina]SIO12204.1 hypothetical protein SAMN02745824_3033 [Parasphingorhabdus marina DSM 22363]